MSNINYGYINDYIESLVPETSDMLEDLEQYAKENSVPIVEKETAQLIRLLIKIVRPKKILEIGTAIGYSAMVMAESFDDCEIVTIERDINMIDVAVKNIENSPYADRINIIKGDANDVLDELQERFDLIFIDAAKGQYLNFFNKSRKLLNDKGLVISDNVLFKGMIASDDLVNKRVRTIVGRLRDYLKYLNELEGYTTSVIPIGDGVALTYREGKDCE